MVLSGTLRVFLFFLSLCLRAAEAQDVDQNTLARIISHIQNTYRPPDHPPDANHPLPRPRQYSVAFAVPAASCQAEFYPGVDFPPGNPQDDVRAAFNEIYQGNRMIGAVPQDLNHFHSEYRLLNPPDPAHAPMQNLLNQQEDCVIFYTYFSPCDGTCLNPNNNRNILAALQMFHEHHGPKAFVFNQLFHNPQGLLNHGQAIENNVWLYRCFPNPDHYECHHCYNEHNDLAQVCQQ